MFCARATEWAANLWAQALLIMGPREVVESWVNQRQFYNHADNSCAPRRQCGLYTQVVWKTTKELGRAEARRIETSLTIFMYFPHGNYVGKKPY